MRVAVDNKVEQQIDNDLDTIQKWWQNEVSQIYSDDRLIYYVDIEDVSFYSDYEQVLFENFRSINKVNIHTRNRTESIKETEITLYDYLTKYIPASKEIADHFYGEIQEEHWSMFVQLTDGLGWIMSSMNFLNILNGISTKSLEITKLELALNELEQGLIAQENVLIGDILRYEIIPVLESYYIRNSL